MDLLAKAQTWLNGIQRTHLATERTLQYVRRSGAVITLLETTIGSYSETVDPNQDRGLLEVEHRDYLIPIEELVGGVPLKGETIRETANGIVYEFEVWSPQGEPEWVWHDRERSIYRVHAQEVKVA